MKFAIHLMLSTKIRHWEKTLGPGSSIGDDKMKDKTIINCIEKLKLLERKAIELSNSINETVIKINGGTK